MFALSCIVTCTVKNLIESHISGVELVITSYPIGTSLFLNGKFFIITILLNEQCCYHTGRVIFIHMYSGNDLIPVF